ncbi:MAG: hypothetical protein ABIH82_03975 [Candidatus Woesearchaeota archaeon]
MKFNFKKISAVAISTLLTGMTMGVAAAANYPTPFVSGGVANTAIVYGTGAGVSDLDRVYGGNIQTDLQKLVTSSSIGTTIITTDGDAYKLEKTSTKFNLGDYVENVTSTKVTEDNLPTLLADGEYTDNNNDDFDYTQTIELAKNTLRVSMFEDNDYKADTPTVGIAIANGASILTYTLDFTDSPLWANLATTNLPLMGKSYYVLSNSTEPGDTLTLLDSASSLVLSEGETKTLTVGDKSYEVSLEFVGDTTAKFNVDGQVTNSLKEAQTYKLSNGAYLGVKDIMYSSKNSGVSKVEFSIGSGKLKLTDGQDVELNEVTISDLSVNFIHVDQSLQEIKIIWNAEDDLFVTEDSIVTMPGFEAVKLSFTGLTYPKEELIQIEADGDNSIVLKDFPLKDSVEDINILYFDGTSYSAIGKDNKNLLAVSENGKLTFDGDIDDYFVASYRDTQDYESYLMKATSFKITNEKQMATFQYKKDGSWTDVKVDAKIGDTITLGSVEFDIYSLDKDSKVAVITASKDTVFNRLYSKEGMEVQLPWKSGKYNLDNSAGTCLPYPSPTCEKRVTIDENMPLNDLNTISWNANVLSGYVPHADITLDNGAVLVFEYAKVNPLNCDITPYPTGNVNTFGANGIVNNNAYAWLNSNVPGPCGDSNFESTHKSLSDWKTFYPNAKIIKIEVEVDNWISPSNSLIENIKINGASTSLILTEKDGNGNLAKGNEITITLGSNIANEVSVTGVNMELIQVLSLKMEIVMFIEDLLILN